MKTIEELHEIRNSLIAVQRQTPLAISRLWVPHCHRFLGIGEDQDRERGCGQEMVRKGAGVYFCPRCNITEERTSQRDCLIDMGREVTAIIGGNRSGKSEAGAMLAVAFAAGKKEKWVRDWLAINGLDEDLIQEEPGNVWVSSLSYADGLSYLRPKLDLYLPHGTKRYFWSSQNQARAVLPSGGVITCKSSDSGAEKYQGASIDFAWLDEEHPEEVYSEVLLRLVDRCGICLLSLTPVKGLSWIQEKFINQKLDGHKVCRLSSLDNPWISSKKIRQTVQHMSEESIRTRLFGDFTKQHGLIYPEFDFNKHIYQGPITDLKRDWPRFRSIDFGTRHPFCCLWAALGPDKTLYVYRELYQTEKTTIENGNDINRLSKDDPPVEYSVADPESRDGRLTLARSCRIQTHPAPKHLGVIEGINIVKEYLHPDANGRVHLYVFPSCKNLIKEFRLYQWSKNQDRDFPKKTNDHAMDSLRYLLMSLDRYLRSM